MGYQTALSGLAAASNDLDVVGNNIANAQTAGFKQSMAVFADLYANSIATAVNNQIGIGTRLAGVQQDFSQGEVTTTDVPTNMAINGNGFFQMLNPNGSVTYSRNGQFVENKAGFIVDAEGDEVMGYQANAQGQLQTGQVVPIRIPNSSLLPPVATTKATFTLNLDAAAAQPKDATFDPTDPDSYTFSTSIKTVDSLGAETTVNLYFVKSATSGQWEVFGGPSGATPTDLGSMTFDSSGALTASASPPPASTPITPAGSFSLAIPNTDGAAAQTITVDLSGTTQFGGDGTGSAATAAPSQDGFGTSQLTNFAIGADGTITGTYSDGRTAVLGQVLLATFTNPNGLQNLGNNQFAQTNDSGEPQVGVAGTSTLGSIQGGAIESSNADLTNSLVDLITAQRNYQANAQTIKTQQTIDQTLINL
ncbi:flagellar hook protein FlgE [Paraburkholderia sp. SARCC-3016]|uniref:flagellar hook protein FlgE n=1 Tax=Paraburkholderia sp. SARCC-3016 TaxID=3058611 RepID=UPI0028085540|nr:flagellar hook protein FlgE [Paraburkholderia sp. SARCC-3016]MDQ7981958.1 flagellar hook protein FlgE [Paraburkholderia sp. SARCC-3016]